MPSIERWRRLSGRPGGNPKKARNVGSRGSRGRGGGRTTAGGSFLTASISWAKFDEFSPNNTLTTGTRVQVLWTESDRGGANNFFTGASTDEVVIPAGVSYIGVHVAFQLNSPLQAVEGYLVKNPAGADELLLRSRVYDNAGISVGPALSGRRIAVSEGDILQIRCAGPTGEQIESFASTHWTIWDDGALLADEV